MVRNTKGYRMATGKEVEFEYGGHGVWLFWVPFVLVK